MNALKTWRVVAACALLLAVRPDGRVAAQAPLGGPELFVGAPAAGNTLYAINTANGAVATSALVTGPGSLTNVMGLESAPPQAPRAVESPRRPAAPEPVSRRDVHGGARPR